MMGEEEITKHKMMRAKMQSPRSLSAKLSATQLEPKRRRRWVGPEGTSQGCHKDTGPERSLK